MILIDIIVIMIMIESNENDNNNDKGYYNENTNKILLQRINYLIMMMIM